MILLPEPSVGGTLEMDCGIVQFRFVDSWLSEPQLFEFYEYALDYYKLSCEVLKMDGNVITCANRYESFYRMNSSKTVTSKDILLESLNGDEDVIIQGDNYNVIETLIDGKWQEYPLHGEGLGIGLPYRVAAEFELFGNWQTVDESTWSFNFKLGRFGTKMINRIIQDGQVIDQKQESSDVRKCEPVE
jgi:hypothetical protein